MKADKSPNLQSEDLRNRRASDVSFILSLKAHKYQCQDQNTSFKTRRPSGRGIMNSLVIHLFLFFFSIQALNGFGDAYPHRGGQSALCNK